MFNFFKKLWHGLNTLMGEAGKYLDTDPVSMGINGGPRLRDRPPKEPPP